MVLVTNLHLIEHPCFERPLRCVRAMHQHVAVSCGGPGLRHRGFDPVGHVGHQRIVRNRGTGWAVTNYEDWDTTVMITPQ
jgi:hypothetical protein